MKVAEENGIMGGSIICLLTKYYFRMGKLRRIRLSGHVVHMSEKGEGIKRFGKKT
jgi:hypothetical protein